MSRTTTMAAILASLAIATPALAQEMTTGTISGTLGLEPAVWYVTSADGEVVSGWKWDGNVVEAKLIGQVRRDAAETTEGALTIVFRTEGNPTEMDVSRFSISMTPDEDGIDGVYSAGAENADLDIEALVISDDSMVIAGSFAGQMIQGGADDLVLDDDVPSITIDGNFQATIPRLDAE